MRVCVLMARGDDSALVVARSLGETVALRAGPPGGEDEALLLRALSLGAARAVRLWDPVLEKTDCSGLATALAAAIRHLGCTLVLVTDRGQGALGPTVADRLDVPHLCGVVSVRLVPGAEAGPGSAEQQLLIKRRIRRGIQELRGDVTAVLCVLPQAATAQAATAQAATAQATTAQATTAQAATDLAEGPTGPMQAAATDPADGVTAPMQATEPADGPRGEVESMDLEQLGIRAQELAQRRGVLTPGARGTAVAPRPVVLDSARELLLRLQRDGLLRR